MSIARTNCREPDRSQKVSGLRVLIESREVDQPHKPQLGENVSDNMQDFAHTSPLRDPPDKRYFESSKYRILKTLRFRGIDKL